MKKLNRILVGVVAISVLAACAGTTDDVSMNVPAEYRDKSDAELVNAASTNARSKRGSIGEARHWSRTELKSRHADWNWAEIDAGNVVVGMNDSEVLLAKGRPMRIDPKDSNRWHYKSYGVVFKGKKVAQVNSMSE